MILPITKIKHVSSINHEGKIVIVVCDKDGQLFYSIRQEGHEENYQKTMLKGWEDWESLPIPDQEVDPSVRKREAKEWSDTREDSPRPIIRSVYRTKDTTAVAPVQMISGIGHLYIFRQQTSGKLAVDRFVLDGMTNKLVPKLQVRFKRSRQCYEPLRKDANGKTVMDSVDFRDANGLPFLEPSTELSILPATHDGWFSVVLLPTPEADHFRWHFFIYNKDKEQLELWSIANGENGLFHLRDRGSHPGISRRVLSLEEGVRITQGPVATKYDVQYERMTEAGPQLLREKVRVMLVAPTSKEGIGWPSVFPVDTDGFLSEIGEAGKQEVLDSYSRNILLPISSLDDDIKGIGQQKAAGTIEALNKGEEDEVWIETDPESLPEMGDEVEISGTKDYNGLHRVVRSTKNTIVIEEVVNNLGEENKKLGEWEEKLDPDESLLFDGMVTSYRKMAGNTIRITSPKHGLQKGDQLQLIGSEGIDGTYAVQDVNKDGFSIDLKWGHSQLINLRLRSKQRRGIHFDAQGDAVKTPVLPLSDPNRGGSFGRTVSAWVYPEASGEGAQLLVGNKEGLLQLLLIDGKLNAHFNIESTGSSDTETICLAEEEGMPATWMHYSASFDYDEAEGTTRLLLMRDGTRVAEQQVTGRPVPRKLSAIEIYDDKENSINAEPTDLAFFSESDFTLECWVKTQEGGPLLTSSKVSGDKEIADLKSLEVDDTGAVVFLFRGDLILRSETRVNDGRWRHVAVSGSHSKNTLCLYIDGKKDAEISGLLSIDWDGPAPVSQSSLSGMVSSEEGEPLAGVKVVVKGAPVGTVTDFDGRFDLFGNGNQGDLLWVFKEGYFSQEIPVGSSRRLDFSLFRKGDMEDNDQLTLGWDVRREHRLEGAIDEVRIWKKCRTAEEVHAHLESPARKASQWEESYWLGGMKEAREGLNYFRGKLSGTQVWNKALPEKVVRDRMFLELRGTESELAVYYPMGGIIGNEVIDFSVNQLHGAVFGDPYYSERTLNRNVLGDQPVSFYRNDDLIAVTQGAKHEERFEFRLLDAEGASVDPDEDPFHFHLWGKWSRGSEEVVDEGFEIVSETITPLGEGWFAATCQFYTPDSIRVLRVFGLQQEVTGAWDRIQLRKHSLKFYANPISLAHFTDEISGLKTLADPGVDLQELPRLEQLRRRYWKEKEMVEGRLKMLSNYSSPSSRDARMAELSKKMMKKPSDLDLAYADPLNYYCKIYVEKGFFGDFFLTPPETGEGPVALTRVMEESLAQDRGRHYWWEFRNTGGDKYFIYRYKYPSTHANPHLLRYNKVEKIYPQLTGYWTLLLDKTPTEHGIKASLQGAGTYYLLLDGGKIVRKDDRRRTEKTLWHIEPGHERVLSPSGEERIDRLKSIIEDTKQEQETLEKAEEWEGLLAKINSKLADVETKISQYITQFNAEVVEQHNPEVEMPELAAANDQLTTRAAYLSFVQAASRLNIMESCEGNLILSYFDTLGRMRQTIFDATADSRNATFQQWLPETVKSCLDFSSNENSLVKFNSQISLGESWTIEFWFSYPLPNAHFSDGRSNKDHVFIGGDQLPLDSRDDLLYMSSPAFVQNREDLGMKELGMYVSPLKFVHIKDEKDESSAEEIELQFLGCGFDMNRLSHGWHHMAVQGSGQGRQGTVQFFIDGKKVRDDLRSRYLIQNPTHESSLKDISFNYGGRVTGIGNFGAAGKVKPKFHIIDYKVAQMAEVRLWDVALSPEEIEMNSRSYLSGNEPGLVAYYPLSEGKGSVVRNHAANYSLKQDLDAQVGNARWMPSTAPVGHPGDQGVYFDGKIDRVWFERSLEIPDNFCVELWFKAEDVKDEQFNSLPYGIFSLNSELGIFGLLVFNETVSVVYDMGSGQNESYNLGIINDHCWHHLALSVRDGLLHLYYDGELKGGGPHPMESGEQFSEGKMFGFKNKDVTVLLGSIDPGNPEESVPSFKGQMADFRIWDRYRTAEEVQKLRFRRLIGTEEGLLLYCPLDEITDDLRVINFSSDNYGRTLNNGGIALISHRMYTRYTNDLPLGSDAVVVSEYPTVAFDPETNKQTAMMWRFLATPRVDKLHLLTHKRIELLEYVWVGNGQFDPTLLGFIEGPPPVPSENLTLEDDYSDATSVALSVAENTEYTWERTQDIFTEMDLSVKLGAGARVAFGGAFLGIALTEVEFKVLAALGANFRYGAQNASQITSSSGIHLNDSLALRGYREEEASLPNVGARFLPKNIGYALVISSMADIFIVRLKRSKKMVSYKVLPLEGVPPQVNTITFMMNPAYCLNGSLDGQVGTAPADKRFYAHAPAMRAQFGSKYPASYMRLDQAFQLQAMIERMDKEREAYYVNFNARLVDETSLDESINDKGSAIKPVKRQGEVSKEDGEKIEEGAEEYAEEAEAKQERAEQDIDKYQAMAEGNAQTAGLATWQTKMEKLLLKAGKQNIVNSYVWDADGGLHVSSESFASSITHSIGGSFSFVGSLGLEWEILAGVAAEMSVAATVGVELTMSKSESTSREFGLEVDLGGLEHRGITDHKDRPLLPGEKVDRYRFSTFFLEGSTGHFNDFFNEVVDPEWLASNDEEARALRQIDTSKPNSAWRILHRVTYVERPALMGFGRDVRPLVGRDEQEDLPAQLKSLGEDFKDVERNTQQLKQKIAKLEQALATTRGQNEAMTEMLKQILATLRDKQGDSIV